MARPLRIVVAGGWYHVVNRGNRRGRIFLTDDDRRRFLALVAELPERFRLEVHAFVLMESHYHLLARAVEANLSAAIQWLQLSYSVRFNWAHQWGGHVFQGRFKSNHIEKEADVAEVARYLHLNPVRIAGLGLGKEDQRRAKVADIPDPGRALISRRLKVLEEHVGSSWRVYGGMDPAPAWLETGVIWRATGGRSRKEWIAAIRDYTEAPVRQGHMERPWERAIGGILGEAEYARRLLEGVRSAPEEQKEARALARVGRTEWEALVSAAEGEKGEKWEDVVNRHGDWTRDAVLFVAVRHAGHRLAEIVRKIPGLKYQAAAQGVKRIAARIEGDPECARFVKRLKVYCRYTGPL